jgi:ADP-ribose pyrophosphatase YjhB (NUDIX family)
VAIDPRDPDELAFLASYDASAYPHPSVAVDVVLLTVAAGGMRTLLLRRSRQPQLGRWAVPGGFVGIDESLDDAAARVLATKAGLEGVFTEQLYTFGDPRRDPRTRVISVVYYALVDTGRLDAAVGSRDDRGLALADLVCPADGEDGALEVRDAAGNALPLAFDHDRVLATAVARVRGKLGDAPIGFELLPETFTLRDLRLVHEAILGRPLNKDSFRRKVLDRGLVVATGDHLEGVGHRPPELYRFVRPAAEPALSQPGRSA